MPFAAMDTTGGLGMLNEAEEEAKRAIASAKEDAKQIIKQSIEAAEEEVKIFAQEQEDLYNAECEKIKSNADAQLVATEKETAIKIELIEKSAAEHMDECVSLLFKTVCGED